MDKATKTSKTLRVGDFVELTIKNITVDEGTITAIDANGWAHLYNEAEGYSFGGHIDNLFLVKVSR